MDERTSQRGRAQHGVLSAAALGTRPARAAAAGGLELVQPRVYVARTQPVSTEVLLEAVAQSVRTRYALLGRGALWLHGAGPVPAPEQLVVGVPHATRLRLEPPVRVSRVTEDVLAHVRQRHGRPVVDLDTAALQSCERTPVSAAAALLEPLLRERRTTVVRLRARCRRGLGGSAVVRLVVDQLVGGSLDVAVRRLAQALERRGVPGLQSEVRFVSKDGASGYADLWCPQARALVEVDGFLTHALRERFRADRRRDRWALRDHDLSTVRVDAAEVFEDLVALADEVADLLLQRIRAFDAVAS